MRGNLEDVVSMQICRFEIRSNQVLRSLFTCSRRTVVISSLAGLAVLGTTIFVIISILRWKDLIHAAEPETPRVGAVASNGFECAAIGADILRANGSAADAAIAMMVCEEVACPESAGIGGGFLLTYYRRETGSVEVLDAREIAAQAAWEGMFVDNGNATAHGGLAIATPGALKGYWVLHQRYGKLPWRKLFEPSINLCYRGHIVNPYMADCLLDKREEILNTPSLKEVFVNPATGDVWQEGDRIKRPDLATTLEIIAKEGSDALYSSTGSLLPKLIQDLKQFNSIITDGDFLEYE